MSAAIAEPVSQTLIEGGPVLTPAGVVPDGAVLLRGSRIEAVGDRADVRVAVSGRARTIDAAGGSILPGFVDAHAHPISTGLLTRPGQSVGYPAVASIAQLIGAVAELTRAAPPGEWVRGRGFDHGKYPEGRLPTRHDIDAVSPRNPVVLIHASGHFALVNTLALERAGVGEAPDDPPAGAFVRDATGAPTGMLLDSAMQLVLPSVGSVGQHGPSHNNFPADPDELARQMQDGLRAFAAAGVTTVVDAQMMARDVPVYLDAWRRGALSVRVVGMLLSNHLDALEALGLAGPLGDERFRLGPLKLYCDGSLSGCTALFHDHEHGGETGTAYWGADDFAELVARTHRFGMQLGIHAQGDAAIGRCLDSIASALASQPRPDHRHRIEHCGAPTDAQIDRIARLGVIPVAQPAFFTQFGDALVDQLGKERAARVHPLASYLRAGIPVAFSSDSPVSSLRPLDAVQAAVLRRTSSGRVLGTQEEIGVVEALRAHTRNAARSVFLEGSIGDLEPGLAADVVVTDRDLCGIPRDEIASCTIRHTFVDGVDALSGAE